VEFRLTPTMATFVIWFEPEAMFCTSQRSLYSTQDCARQETILQMSCRLTIRGLRLKELRLPVFCRLTWLLIPISGADHQTADTDLKDFGDTEEH
jgi:hypothetical protein